MHGMRAHTPCEIHRGYPEVICLEVLARAHFAPSSRHPPVLLLILVFALLSPARAAAMLMQPIATSSVPHFRSSPDFARPTLRGIWALSSLRGAEEMHGGRLLLNQPGQPLLLASAAMEAGRFEVGIPGRKGVGELGADLLHKINLGSVWGPVAHMAGRLAGAFMSSPLLKLEHLWEFSRAFIAGLICCLSFSLSLSLSLPSSLPLSLRLSVCLKDVLLVHRSAVCPFMLYIIDVRDVSKSMDAPALGLSVCMCVSVCMCLSVSRVGMWLSVCTRLSSVCVCICR